MAIDWKITLSIIILKSIVVKTVTWLRKSSVKNKGKLPMSMVIEQGNFPSCINDYISDMTIKEVPNAFRKLLEDNINTEYRQEGSLPANIDKLPNEKKTKFMINNTRVSTYFIFTDGKRCLFHNRKTSSEYLQRVENYEYDFFGAVTFENCTLPLKVGGNKGFFDSKILQVSCVPGFAFEDTVEPEDNLFGRQTVIMLGFELLIKSEDLDKAESTETSKIEIRKITSIPDGDLLTSKAKHGMSYLNAKYA